MEVPPQLQLSITFFTGVVAATFVPSVRRAIPRPIEILLWVAFVTVCALGVASITDPNARELSTSGVWGVGQIINTSAGLMLGGVGGWISEHRFPIARWLLIVTGTDIFALIFLGSLRSAQRWQPRVRLGEWMEIATPVHETAIEHRQQAADPLAGASRRIAAWSAIAATAALAKIVDSSVWMRAVIVSRVQSQARLDELRDATAHLRFAVLSWCTAAVEPIIKRLVAPRGLKPMALEPGDVIDIQALLPSPGEHDAAEPQRSDRLAS